MKTLKQLLRLYEGGGIFTAIDTETTGLFNKSDRIIEIGAVKVENGQITENLKSDIRNTQHYVGIPVNAYYNIVESKFVNFYAYAGGTIEKCVADEYRVLTKDVLHKESVKGIQTSANLGIGVEFMLGKHLGIYIDPSARYYFNCNQPKSIRTAQPLMLGFEMGLRVNL